MTTTSTATDSPDDAGDDDKERTRKLIRTISDKSRSLEVRDAAKNELLMLQVNSIDKRVRRLTGGRIGISDRSTELFNSAFADLKKGASNIAKSVEQDGYPLHVVVAQRLKGWAASKIRKTDGQTLKRGEGREKEPVTVLDHAQADTQLPDDEAMRNEIKAVVFSAVAELNGFEHAVITSYFGMNDEPQLSMREIADELGISLADAQNARRRAQYKLKQWLDDHDPNIEVEAEGEGESDTEGDTEEGQPEV